MNELSLNQENSNLNNNSRVLAKPDQRQRAWLEVDPSAIEKNAWNIKQCISQSCILMAVVKADGYGHGAETVAKAALKGGAVQLGVATLQEGIDLREAGINCPILVLGNLINQDELSACINWRLMPTISSLKEVSICESIAEQSNQKFPFHLKIDTGMTRLGCEFEEAPKLIEIIDSSPNLILKGLYTHLALADEESSNRGSLITAQQKNRFEKIVNNLSDKRDSVCCHLANSAGTLRESGLHFDMVRIGIALYGYSPIKNFKFNLSLKPALSVKARVTFIRSVSSGIGVSYGHKFITKRQSRLAVVGIGYADGVSRALSGKISVLINGKKYPQIGAITMDQLIVDITEDKDIRVGSIVTLLGSDGYESISPYQWSEASGSIPWEILCSFKHRLPRVII